MIAVQSSVSASHRDPSFTSSSPVSPRASSPFIQDRQSYTSSPMANTDAKSQVEDQNLTARNSPSSGTTADGNTQKTLSPIQTDKERLLELNARIDGDEETVDEPQSVIHAPAGFETFVAKSPGLTQNSDTGIEVTTGLGVKHSDSEKKSPLAPSSPTPITTAIPSTSDSPENTTPRAQTRQEVDDSRRKSRHLDLGLEDILESSDTEQTDQSQDDQDDELDDSESMRTIDTRTIDTTTVNAQSFHESEEEISALRTALSECWTLCNTLASLSSIHRKRLFNFHGHDDMQEQAWKSCWRLCQELYETRDSHHPSLVRPTLDLCREFCQALFEVRVKDNEVADSVLRVSFELNNHLFNTHDRNLPEAFRERTLDFYITLCHRLMKQRTRLTQETDSLLRACWSLAEMLFSIRQSRREGRPPDNELLGSAVQACWELCDLFREGWTQVRPDRGTPRPSQTTFNFTQEYYLAKQAEDTDSAMEIGSDMLGLMNPETPTTIFDDTATTVSPDQAPVPNILVLGYEAANTNSSVSDIASSSNNNSNNNIKNPNTNGNASARPPHPPRWSSNSSSRSGFSRLSGQTTSSTHTVKSPATEDQNLRSLKLLLLRAAMNAGFQRSGPESLPVFAKVMPSDSFGTAPWQMSLLGTFKKLVSVDPAFKVVEPPSKGTAVEIAGAVNTMVMHNAQYGWLRDLYRLVFGFYVDEGISKNGVTIQT